MTSAELGQLGIWLLIGSSAVIVVELAVAGFWSLRLARRGQALAIALQQERGVIEADVERLRALMDETRVLWAPYRRALRFLQHPLVIALLGSYRRRRVARRI